MRVLIVYLAFGVAAAMVEQGGMLRADDLAFWRDVAAWPVVVLDRTFDLRGLISSRMQDYAALCFAAAMVAYALARLDVPFLRAARERRDRPRRPAA